MAPGKSGREYGYEGPDKMIPTSSPAEEIAEQNQKAKKAIMPRWLLYAFLGSMALLGYRLWTQNHEAIVSKFTGPKTKKGIVTGIFYSQNKTAAVVGGQIVKEGDTVNGVKVLRIRPDTVEFERDDKVWSQKIEQKANPAWSRSNKSKSQILHFNWLERLKD